MGLSVLDGRLTFTFPAAWKHCTHRYSLWSCRIQLNLLLQQYRLIARAHQCLEGESSCDENAIIHLPCTSSKLKFFQDSTNLLMLLTSEGTEFILTYTERKQQSVFSISCVPGKLKKTKKKDQLSGSEGLSSLCSMTSCVFFSYVIPDVLPQLSIWHNLKMSLLLLICFRAGEE